MKVTMMFKMLRQINHTPARHPERSEESHKPRQRLQARFLTAFGMTHYGKLATLALVAILLAGWTELAYAADVTAQASLSSNVTPVGESVQYQITITGARSAEPPSQISVNGLDINYSGQSMQTQIINFDVSTSLILTYNVLPQRSGTFVIPGQPINAAGKTITTNSVTLIAGSNSGSGNAGVDQGNAKLAFIELVVSKDRAYVGEAVPVEIRLFIDSRMRFQNLQLSPIKSDGLTTQKLTEPINGEIMRDGRRYNQLTLKTAITAVKTGKITFGPVEFNCIAQLPQKRQHMRSPFGGNIDDLFNDPFFGFAPAQKMTIRSDPVELDVRPLPPNAPKTFSGAVGRFSLATQASPLKVGIGDPITLTLKIAGQGNFDRVGAPQMIEEPGWRSYPPSNKFIADDDIGISGCKTFEMAIIPEDRKPTLPDVKFTYFDTVTEKYVTLSAERLPITVEGQKASSTPEPVMTRTPAKSGSAIAGSATPTPSPTPQPEDILYIRTDSGNWNKSFDLLYLSRGFWLAQLVPLAALLALGGMAYKQRRRRDERRIRLAALRHEKDELMILLKREDTERQAFYEAAVKAIQTITVLSDLRPPSSIGAEDACAARSLDEATAKGVQELFARQGELSYAGGSGSGKISSTERANVLQTIRNFEEAAPNV